MNKAEIFKKNATPIRSTMKIFQMQQMFAKQTNSLKMMIVTARNNFDDQELFLQVLGEHGIDTNLVQVECVGDIEKNSSAAKKLVVIEKSFLDDTFHTVTMYDDDQRNLQTVRDFLVNHKVSFFPYIVKDGLIIPD